MKEDILSQLDPNSYRAQLAQSAKSFKTNWVEFGEHLTKVASDQLFKEWGYMSFEDYCREEIRIKKATAMKLTNAYFFISKEDPAIIKSGNLESLDIDAVSVLRKAKMDGNCTPENYDLLRESALEKGHVGQTIARKMKKLTEDELDSGKAFYEENYRMVVRLQKRTKHVGSFPDEHKIALEKMSEFFLGASA